MEREHTANRSLLMIAGAVLADPQPMLARLVRGRYAAASPWPSLLTCPLINPAIALLAVTVKGGKLSYMALALICEQTAYRSLLMVAGAVLAGLEPILARLE